VPERNKPKFVILIDIVIVRVIEDVVVMPVIIFVGVELSEIADVEIPPPKTPKNHSQNDW